VRLFPLLLAAMLAQAQQLPPLPKVYPGPEQPIPFHHSSHAAVACQDCHPTPDPGDFAEIVATSKCMSCHASVKPDSPAIQKLATFHKKGQPIPWEPVYLTADYVFFSHRAHAAAGAGCADCHGDVAAAQVLAKERDISMAACMDCHRSKGASLACDFCHEPRGAAIP
jgi:hypothetical protein